MGSDLPMWREDAMRIETEHLILRSFRESDAGDVYEYLKEPQMHCFVCMKITSMEQAVQETETRAKDSEHYLAIEEKQSGRVIGEIFAHAEHTDPTGAESDTYSPCWMLHPDYCGKGYGYEAAHAFLDYLFYGLDARRIYIYTEDYNTPCRKLCEKLGARQEGMFVEFVSFIKDEQGNPIYENTCQYAILKREWETK